MATLLMLATTKKAGSMASGFFDFQSSCLRDASYALNELPQPQVFLAFGLLNWKPRCSMPS